MTDFDLIVRNGTIVDGSGRPGIKGDVAVHGGHIVASGAVTGDARQEIDATGLAVTPGFVDVHTHLDVQLFFDRTMMVSPWHGVTTVSMGNCGLGIAPTRPEHRERMLRNLQHVEGMDYATTSAGMGDDWGFETFPEYLDAVERRELAINTIAQIGHVALKTYVLGDEAAERVATDDERATMKALITEALDAGAFGFSTDQSESHFGDGGLPIASRITTQEELLDLVSAMSDLPNGLFTIGWPPARSNSLMTKELFAQFMELAPNVHFHGRNPNVLAVNSEHAERIAYHEALNAHGRRNHMQFCCLPMQFEASMLDPFMPFVDFPPQLNAELEPCRALMAPVLSADTPDARMAIYRAEGFRDRLRAATSGTNWDRVFALWTFTEVPQHAEWDLRNVAEVALEQGAHPTDLLLDLQLAAFPEATRFNMGFFNFDEDEVGRVLQHPLVIPGNSDAGAHVAQMLDARFPTYLLSKFVRERGDLSFEWAIRKLSYESAQSLGLTDRGLVQPGMRADLVVIDPETVRDGPLERRSDFPAGGSHLVSEAIGIEHVVVNGTPIRAHGEDLLDPDQPMPGQLLRNAR